MTYDYLNSIFLVGLLAFILVTYSLRLLLRGRTRYDRVDRQGGSVLLGKGMMEMAYWSLQPLAQLLIRIHVTPNMISWASLVLGGCAGVALAYGYFGGAALLATASAFMDSLDGIVARETGVASDAGEVLDAAIDRYVEFFFLGGLVVYYHDVFVLQFMSLLALVGCFMVSYSTAKAEALHVPPPPGIMRRHERAFYLILGAALSPIAVPSFEAHFNLPLPIGLPMVIAVTLVAILSNIAAIERLYTIAHAVRLREIEALEGRALAEEEAPAEELLEENEGLALSDP